MQLKVDHGEYSPEEPIQTSTPSLQEILQVNLQKAMELREIIRQIREIIQPGGTKDQVAIEEPLGLIGLGVVAGDILNDTIQLSLDIRAKMN